MDLSFLPAVNASLNGLTIVLLSAGVVMVKQKRIEAHQRCMYAAFGTSVVFLAFYLLHKAWKASTGDTLHTTFNHTGVLKAAYLAILLTHLVLAMVVPVLAIWLIVLGRKRQDALHRKVAKWAFPIWMYVSVTGVLIYFMLYHWNPPQA